MRRAAMRRCHWACAAEQRPTLPRRYRWRRVRWGWPRRDYEFAGVDALVATGDPRQSLRRVKLHNTRGMSPTDQDQGLVERARGGCAGRAEAPLRQAHPIADVLRDDETVVEPPGRSGGRSVGRAAARTVRRQFGGRPVGRAVGCLIALLICNREFPLRKSPTCLSVVRAGWDSKSQQEKGEGCGRGQREVRGASGERSEPPTSERGQAHNNPHERNVAAGASFRRCFQPKVCLSDQCQQAPELREEQRRTPSNPAMHAVSDSRRRWERARSSPERRRGSRRPITAARPEKARVPSTRQGTHGLRASHSSAGHGPARMQSARRHMVTARPASVGGRASWHAVLGG